MKCLFLVPCVCYLLVSVKVSSYFLSSHVVIVIAAAAAAAATTAATATTADIIATGTATDTATTVATYTATAYSAYDTVASPSTQTDGIFVTKCEKLQQSRSWFFKSGCAIL